LLLKSSLDKNGLTSGHLAHSLWLIFGCQGQGKWHAAEQLLARFRVRGRDGQLTGRTDFITPDQL
jgi:hypothetical protein